MQHLFSISFVFLLILIACEKTDDIPCTTFPCGSDHPDNYNYNRVAFDPEFRIGTWVNIASHVPAKDTIIFHNDTAWSNFNSYGGIYNGKYDFWELYLRSYMDYNGNELVDPFQKETYYYDSTGVLSIFRGIQSGSVWDHYIKIE
jgi:hypothetical protein